MVGLVEPFGDGVNLPVLRLGLQPDLCLLPCSVVLATKSRPSSGARIGFMDASMFFTWQACGALSPSHESRRKAGTLQMFRVGINMSTCPQQVPGLLRPLVWHLRCLPNGIFQQNRGAAPSPLLTQCLLKPQQRLRLSCGADVGVSLLTSLTALQAAGKSNHWQM